MNKPALIWIEQLVTPHSSEVPPILADSFSIRSTTNVEVLDRLIAGTRPACIFFDFDYPDRRRLSHFANAKSRFPSIPIVMMTLQHSESLAIWAYRHGALDYLIKPVDAGELGKCVDRILEISALQSKQQSRDANLFKPPIPNDVPNAQRNKNERLSPAIFFVQQNYSQRIYSDAVARLCGMSASHFSREFKLAYKMTFQEFLLRYRVRQACHQLQRTDVSVADVAYNVGFTDPSYFTRVFKRYAGVAPSSYTAANDDVFVEEVVVQNTEDKMTSSSQIVRSLATSFRQ